MPGRLSGPYFKEGVKLFLKYLEGHPQKKVLTCQEFSGMGCLNVFGVKGKKPQQVTNQDTFFFIYLSTKS